MSKKKKGRWIAIGICGILLIVIIAAVIIFIYRTEQKENTTDTQTAMEQGVLDSENPFLALDGSFTEQKISDSESALAAIEEVSGLIGIQDTDTELSVASEETALENTYYRFEQKYEGIPVYGRNLIVSADGDGNALSLSGNFRTIGGINTEPALSEDEALEVARETFGEDATITNEGLAIYSLNGVSPKLTWKLYVSSKETAKYCFLSSVNGDIIAELPLIYTERVLCSGEDVDGNSQNFYAEHENGEYIMVDSERDITICDANNSTLKKEFLIETSNGNLYSFDDTNFYDEDGNIVYANGNNYSFTITDEQDNVLGTDGQFVARLWTDNIFTTVDPVVNDSDVWDNDKAVTLMTRISTIYDFWQSEYYRNSYDGKNGATVGVYDDYKNVGFFIGDTTNAESYGSPNIPITILSFGTDNPMSMDTIAHEFMHSVERSISSMSYESESGALMEAYSDIFGEIVEDWSDDGEYNNSCDWNHGSRNMISPKSGDSALPDTYQGDHWADTSNPSDENDHGGVHTNNTVISHAAYLMNVGIDGSNAFESLSTKEISDLFYSTLFVLPSDCTFEQFRTLIQNTANILCEQGILTEKQRACVSNAFFQIGIESAAILVSRQVSLDIYDINGEIYDDYTLYIIRDGERTDYAGTSGNTDGIVFSDIGEYELQIVDNANTDNVTTLTVRVVEDGGASQIPIYTQCGLADVDELVEAITPDDEETAPAGLEPEEIYADVLDMFYHNIQTGWAEYNEMPSLYGDEFCYLFPMSFSDPSYIDNIGYSFIDLNRDGTDELLIGMDSEEEQQYGDIYQNAIYDLYTYMDDRIIHLATSGERFTYQLCEDNTIYYFGSSGAASNAYYHYQLDSNEPVFSTIECVYSEPDENWENVYWYHATSGVYNPETYSHEGEEASMITEAEATTIRDAWPQRVDFSLTYFSDYTPQTPYNTETESQSQDTQSAGVLTQAQIDTIRASLGVPDGLEVEVTQSEMSYWDAGQCWVVIVSFSSNGSFVASATVNAETGEMLKDILMYTG